MVGIIALGKSLVSKGISFGRELITNARVGKQVLASGATVTTTTGAGGTNTLVGPGGSFAVPVWVWYVLGAALVVPLIIIPLFKMLLGKKR